jgi:crossover junction endodeoxyribonuclease RusA
MNAMLNLPPLATEKEPRDGGASLRGVRAGEELDAVPADARMRALQGGGVGRTSSEGEVAIRVELPFPPADLSPNRAKGRHWGALSAARKRYCEACWALTLAQIKGFVAPAGNIALRITFVQPDKRRRDVDNLMACAKNGIDGFAAALKVDDSRFEPLTISRAYGGKPGALIVEIA